MVWGIIRIASLAQNNDLQLIGEPTEWQDIWTGMASDQQNWSQLVGDFQNICSDRWTK